MGTAAKRVGAAPIVARLEFALSRPLHRILTDSLIIASRNNDDQDDDDDDDDDKLRPLEDT